FVRYRFTNELFGIFLSDGLQNARNDVAFALYRADDGGFSRGRVLPAVSALIPMLIFFLPADEAFINLDNAPKLFNIFHHGGSDLVTHFPSGFVRTVSHVPENLHCAHALFASEHEMRDAKPVTERLVGVFEDRADQDREPIAVGRAFLALPMPLAGRQVVDRRIPASWTSRPLWPTAGLQIGLASVFVWEQVLEFCGRKLV